MLSDRGGYHHAVLWFFQTKTWSRDLRDTDPPDHVSICCWTYCSHSTLPDFCELWR